MQVSMVQQLVTENWCIISKRQEIISVSYTHMPKDSPLLLENKAFSDPIWLFLNSLSTLKSLNQCLELERHYVLLAWQTTSMF